MKERYLYLSASKLLMMVWKAEETRADIEKGSNSYSKDLPILVSYFPDKKKYLIMDGHHRAIELFNEGNKSFYCKIAIHQPKTYNIDYPVETLKSFLLNQKN